MKNSFLCSLFACASLVSAHAMAFNIEVQYSEDKAYSIAEQGNEPVEIQSNREPGHAIDDSIARASTPCPPFCVSPLEMEEGVATVGELELVKFAETALHSGKGVLVDVRASNWYQQETIPGSVNIPFTVFEKSMEDPALVAVLEQLGAKKRDKVGVVMRTLEKIGLFDGDKKTADWDFSGVKTLMLWCNGPWCGQSPRAIRALISMGYPADKLYYYRGGMQMWQSLGLSTVVPTDLSTYASK